MSHVNYSPEEILQILRDFYNFQSVFDPEVDAGAQLTFATSIADWISICDLISHKKLAEYYHKLFNLNTPVFDLESILKNKSSTLEDFCRYISAYAQRQRITPVVIMSKSCETAAIFKTLMNNLAKRGVDTQNISPGSEIAPLFERKKSYIWLEEVNKLAPGSLTKFNYQENKVMQVAWAMFGLFAFSTVAVSLIRHFHWGLLVIMFISVILFVMGNRIKPAKITIGSYKTVRDLVLSMHAKINY
ncbi:hypothetical protein ACFQZS_16590 [Mucilaginibacter calamicampi]|uniref:Uncharacterized protein n=1 Tax=Mucilaginibacter calamicampi TaxID=1302352 RepID=A0ABW2YZF8_9SPHI